MSLLSTAEKHPFRAVALLAIGFVSLGVLAERNVYAAIVVAGLIAVAIGLEYIRDASAPYRTLDCRDEHHVACDECWCECHTTEEAAA